MINLRLYITIIAKLFGPKILTIILIGTGKMYAIAIYYLRKT